jgi:uncharacterized membrane protein YgdD (TMEM256/DUF423 family)
MFKQALTHASILGCTAVIIGAFGAHYLKTIFSLEQLQSFDTGVKYQFYHVFALAFTGVLGLLLDKKYCKYATWFFTIGILFFSGSIYVLNFLASKDIIGIKGIGIITPIGGLFLIAGWITLFFGIINKK